MNKKLDSFVNNNLLGEFIKRESKIKYGIIYDLNYFFSCFFLMIPKAFLLIIINFFSNLGISNLQITLFNLYCIIDILFLLFILLRIFSINEKFSNDSKFLIFIKFYFPISANIIVMLFLYIIPNFINERIIFSTLIWSSLFIINSLTIHIILRDMIFSIREMIINFVFYQLLNILFFVTERENRSFILETCKSVYYIVFLIITKYFSEINNKIKVLDASNQSFLKLVLFFNGNFINNTILVNKDCDEKLNIIYEKKINEFFSINFIENDVLAFKLYSSSKKLKEFNIVNKLNSNTKDNFNYCCKNNQEKNLLNNNYHSSIAMNKFEKIGKKGNDFIELGMKNKITIAAYFITIKSQYINSTFVYQISNIFE